MIKLLAKKATTRFVKQLLNVLFFALLSPVVMGAIPNSTFSAKNPQLAPADDQQINLSSSDFGINGPLFFGFQYSKELGMMLKARLTQGLGVNNATAIELEGGKNQYRVNLTWGHALTAHQRFKVSAEYLAQNLDFYFDAGKVDEWIGQPAYGLTYEYLFTNSFVNDINVNAFYSRAISKSLDPKIYTLNGTNYENFRHIAGGTDKSASIGIDLLPASKTLVGLQVNYDNLDYNTHYERGYDQSGLGATATLDQVITNRVKFNLLASDRKPYQKYQAGLKWLLNNAPGNTLELGINGTRIIGSKGIGNDSRVEVDMDYRWGGDTVGHPAVYGSFANHNSTSDLRNWTAKPAVHMDQVLAVRDQKSVALTSTAKPSQLNLVHNKFEISVHPGLVNIKIQKYVPENDQLSNYAINNLPTQLHYKNGVISGTFTKKEVGKSYTVELDNVAQQNGYNNSPIQLLIQVNTPQPYPEPSNQPTDQTFQPNTTITPLQYVGYYNDVSSPKGLFHDDYWKDNTLHIEVDKINAQLQGSGLTATYTPDNDDGILTIQGTTTGIQKDYPIDIYASNMYGESITAQSFVIHVKNTTPAPTLKLTRTTTFTEGDQLNNYVFATADAGDGMTFKQASDITVGAVTANGTIHSLSDFNLSAVVTLHSDNKTATIALQQKSAAGIQNPEYSPQNFVITAKNSGEESAYCGFTLQETKHTIDPTVQLTKTTTFAAGDQLNSYDFATANAGQGETFDSTDSIVVNAVANNGTIHPLSDFNLSSVITLSADHTQGTIALQQLSSSGVQHHDYSPQNYVITATNHSGNEAHCGFTVQVHQKIVNPTVNLTQSTIFNQGDQVNNYAFASANAGDGATFSDDGIKIDAVDAAGDLHPLSDFNLKDVITYNGDHTQATIALQQLDASGVQHHDYSPQNYVILAKNSEEQSAVCGFTLVVNKQITNPTVILTQPTTFTEGDQIVNYAFASASAGDQETFDSADDITVGAVDAHNDIHPLSDFNLSSVVTLNGDHTGATIALQQNDTSGIQHPEYSPQNFVITAKNHDGREAYCGFTVVEHQKTTNPSVVVSKTPTFTEGDQVNAFDFASASAGQNETFDDASKIVISAQDTQGKLHPLTDFNLNADVTLNGDHTTATIALQQVDQSGVKHPDYSPQNYVITATNHSGLQGTGNFTLTVNKKINNPTVTVTKVNPTYTEGDTPNDGIANAYAGDNEQFDTTDPNTIKVEATDSNGLHPLSDFGLQASVSFSDNQHAAINLKNINGETVKDSQDSPQAYVITATNMDKKDATGNFTLTVKAQPQPSMAYLQCPTQLHSEGGKMIGSVTDTKGVPYTFSGRDIKGFSLDGLKLRQAGYYTTNQMQCVYVTREGVPVNIATNHVPKESGASDVRFTKTTHSVCPATQGKDVKLSEQVAECKLQYKLSQNHS